MTLLLALAHAAVVVAGAVWMVVEVFQREPRLVHRWVWWVAVLASVASAPVAPSVGLGAQTTMQYYAGEDLLSDVRPVEREVSSRWGIPGIDRTRVYRTTQGDTLLNERRVVNLGVPAAFLFVIGAWVFRRRGL